MKKHNIDFLKVIPEIVLDRCDILELIETYGGYAEFESTESTILSVLKKDPSTWEMRKLVELGYKIDHEWLDDYVKQYDVRTLERAIDFAIKHRIEISETLVMHCTCPYLVHEIICYDNMIEEERLMLLDNYFPSDLSNIVASY